MILSAALGMVLTVGGLWLSYALDLPTGATIILLLAVAFMVSTVIKKLF